ncbi:hypothetical protein CPLU01_03070 [Colletotrichum plurivorum]|uniref:F-box domain-containing protein n=1 Tax=Colletotrichum plurivorum TaxID=2175906 RepID=A0A8H6KV21_9PEZI|nr:hypothetical protein CPLU01_03070 [Colletotrichum plurivorum]
MSYHLDHGLVPMEGVLMDVQGKYAVHQIPPNQFRQNDQALIPNLSVRTADPVTNGPKLAAIEDEKLAQLGLLPFELKNSIGRYLLLKDAKALSNTCRAWREALISVVFEHVKIGRKRRHRESNFGKLIRKYQGLGAPEKWRDIESDHEVSVSLGDGSVGGDPGPSATEAVFHKFQDLPPELRDLVASDLAMVDARALSGTCRLWRERLVPRIFKRVDVEVWFYEIPQILEGLGEINTKPILDSMRRFRFVVPEFCYMRPREDPRGYYNSRDFKTAMAERACGILRGCQEALKELTIITYSDPSAEEYFVYQLLALCRERQLEFKRLRILHLDTSSESRFGPGFINSILIPASPNIHTLRVTEPLIDLMAGDARMYSSVTYLMVRAQKEEGFTLEKIKAIVERFTRLRSLMLDGPIRQGDYEDLVKVMQKQCPPSLSQLAIQCRRGPQLEDLAGRFFEAVPQLVLLQGIKNRSENPQWVPMARRQTEETLGSASGRDFLLGRVEASHSSKRFRTQYGRRRAALDRRPQTASKNMADAPEPNTNAPVYHEVHEDIQGGNPVSVGPELVQTAMENCWILRDKEAAHKAHAKVLSGTCRVWREVLVPVIFRRVKLGSSPEVGRGLVVTDSATESKIFSRTYRQLRHLADDKAMPILSSIRSFNFCVPENALAPYEAKEASNTRMAELLSAVLRRCQPTLQELSIDTSLDEGAESLAADSFLYSPHARDELLARLPNPPLRFDRLRALHLQTSLSTHMAEAVAMSAGEAYSSVRCLVVKTHFIVGIHLRSIGRIVGRFPNLESLMLETNVEYGDMGVHKTIQEQCTKIKQLAIPFFYGALAEPMAREYFAAMPRLVLLQGVEYDRRGGSGPIAMARRTERAPTDGFPSPSDSKDTFRMGYVIPSHALERFQCMARGGGGAVAEDRLHETLTDEEFTL